MFEEVLEVEVEVEGEVERAEECSVSRRCKEVSVTDSHALLSKSCDSWFK